MNVSPSHLLFIINPGSGNNNTDWEKEIRQHFRGRADSFELFALPNPFDEDALSEKIRQSKPAKVVAVGGDGTVKLIAGCLSGTSIPLCIVPAGSANGMARELGIPDDPKEVFETIQTGRARKIHMVKVNGESCIHLSDIGFNAFVVKKFEDENRRGMWGYIKAAWKVLWQHSRMEVRLRIDNEEIYRKAAMVVIANATMYGNGVVINPLGSLYDKLFEVVIIRKVSFSEIFKMRFTQKDFNPQKTELFQARSLSIRSKHLVHFQVDGEYLGKVNKIEAAILPEALYVIVPAEKSK